jgi:flagellar motility protein MotE (MotC chaperone)
VTESGKTGSSPLKSILGLLLGGGAAMVVVALFMTGLAQQEIIPMIQQRAERAVGKAKSAVTPADNSASDRAEGANGATAMGAADSAKVAAARSDSMRALGAQIETQKAFLARREEELTRMRAGIDSLQQKSALVDDAELKRQAKLFAAMKPDAAAPVLSELDDATLAMMLGAMNPKAAAKVMAKLDAIRVARLASQAVHKGEWTGLVPPAGQEVGSATR